MRAGHTARIEVLPAMREHQPSARFLGDELPANGPRRGRIRVTDPPSVLEDSRRLPARNFAVDVHGHVVMMLHQLAAEATVDVDAGTEPFLDVFWLGEHGPYAWRRMPDVALESHVVTHSASSGDPFPNQDVLAPSDFGHPLGCGS